MGMIKYSAFVCWPASNVQTFPVFLIRLSDDQYFVVRDERLTGDGAKAKVPFPKRCRQLRVYCYAWFEKEKEWRVIRDKLCNNGRRKKTVTLRATNATVKPFELL